MSDACIIFFDEPPFGRMAVPLRLLIRNPAPPFYAAKSPLYFPVADMVC
ncbi:MAG: hypothetical protein BWX70_01595 [Verrucomicrobia bacterium ADurb.Bin070]|nr:MAG: hypothetical protein BWX70_01595 [Verrucomicrobia bacterium ADurb.Bin070]